MRRGSWGVLVLLAKNRSRHILSTCSSAPFGLAGRADGRRRIADRSILHELEYGDHLDEITRLLPEAFRCGGALLVQGRVLLRDLIHLADRFTDLRHAAALLTARRADLGHDVGDTPYGGDRLSHRDTCLVGEQGPLPDALNARSDQGLDLLGRLRGPSREATHLAGHHSETSALIARTGCLDRRV